jgi:hypothetical protein
MSPRLWLFAQEVRFSRFRASPLALRPSPDAAPVGAGAAGAQALGLFSRRAARLTSARTCVILSSVRQAGTPRSSSQPKSLAEAVRAPWGQRSIIARPARRQGVAGLLACGGSTGVARYMKHCQCLRAGCDSAAIVPSGSRYETMKLRALAVFALAAGEHPMVALCTRS